MSVFSAVGGLKPSKTAFNLSHSNLFDCSFGELVPVSCIECVPGDVFKMNANMVGRLTSALKAPILADMDVVLESFFVPSRLLMGRDANFDTPAGEATWEDFIRCGKEGKTFYPLPRFGSPDAGKCQVQLGHFHDFLGVQPKVDFVSKPDQDDRPLALPLRAYRFIWNEFYRLPELMDEIQVCQYLGNGSSSDNTLIADADYESLLRRCWRSDYFTSALPFQQFGTAPAFQLDGVLPVDFEGYTGVWSATMSGGGSPTFTPNSGTFNVADGSVITATKNKLSDGSVTVDVLTDGGFIGVAGITGTVAGATPNEGILNVKGKAYPKGSVNLNNAVTFDISDIRVNFAIQKWYERKGRAGVRYTEMLRSHFGVAPSDSRLQRPEFISACRIPWLVNEVVQTSATAENQSAQGNQAGQAVVLGQGKLGKYKCYEYGYILVLASVVPKPQYQQGIPRMFSRQNIFDFYTPEFMHLSEQAVLNKEIFVTGNPDLDNGIFGFQGIWNELRFLPSRVSNHMRSDADYTFDYWHLARNFAETPVLNSEFLQIGGTAESLKELMRVFAVDDENPFILHIGLNMTGVRPLNYLADPGLVDHF